MAGARYRGLLASYLIKIPTPQITPGTSPSGPYVGDPGETPPPEFGASEIIDLKMDGSSPGPYPGPLRCILATCTTAESEGDSVYVTSTRDTVNDCVNVLKCDTSNAAKMPAVGTIIKKFDSTCCLVSIPGSAELLPGTGTYTVGAHYFVGSDAKPCKAGDANVPAGGQIKQSIGIALTSKVILRLPGLPSAATW